MSDIQTPESVVQIDELHLDKECIRLPSDYLKYAHLAADAKRKVDEVSNRLKVLQAELGSAIRAAPEDHGIDKVTEAAVTGAVLSNPNFQKGTVALQAAEYDYSLAQAVVWALEHKKRTLTLLVELHGMGYFSSPRVSEKGRAAVEEMTRQHVRRPQSHED